MIPALSPSLGLLAPKAAGPSVGDSAAFQLLLAGAGELAVERQPAATTGKPLPPPPPIVLASPAIAAPLFPNGELGADVPAPVPNGPIARPVLPSKPAAVALEPVGWPRFAQAETCAAPGPADDPPNTTSEPELADPSPPVPRMASIDRNALPIQATVAMTLDPETAIGVRAIRAPGLPSPTGDTVAPAPMRSTSPARETSIVTGDLDPEERIGRPIDDEPRPMVGFFLHPAPTASRPDASGAEVPTDLHVDAAGPVPTRTPPAALPARPAGRAGSATDPATIWAQSATAVARDPARARLSAMGPPPSPTAAPSLFVGLPFRPLPDTGTPVAQPVDRAKPVTTATPPPATSAPTVSLATLAGTAAPALVISTVQQATETVVPRTVVPDRLPVAPNAIGAIGPTVVRAVMNGSAVQVFAADLRRTARDPRQVAGELPAAPIETARLGMAGPAAAAPIDLRQDGWPSAMVDRIERLRDAVDATDTRIRLVPDALGVVDVEVKRDGDTVHVRFTAEQAATRALLQDAAPRLAEAAEARGLKLGQTAVGDGGSQPNGRQPQPGTPLIPTRPRSSADADADADVTDTRIA